MLMVGHSEHRERVHSYVANNGPCTAAEVKTGLGLDSAPHSVLRRVKYPAHSGAGLRRLASPRDGERNGGRRI